MSAPEYSHRALYPAGFFNKPSTRRRSNGDRPEWPGASDMASSLSAGTHIGPATRATEFSLGALGKGALLYYSAFERRLGKESGPPTR